MTNNHKAFELVIHELTDGTDPNALLEILKLQGLELTPVTHNLPDIVDRYVEAEEPSQRERE